MLNTPAWLDHDQFVKRYKKYIASGNNPTSHWYYCRMIVLERCQLAAGVGDPWYRCERCGLGTFRIQCHHKTYANFEHENPHTQVQGVCADCHMHIGKPYRPFDPRAWAISLGLHPDSTDERIRKLDWHNQPTYNARVARREYVNNGGT